MGIAVVTRIGVEMGKSESGGEGMGMGVGQARRSG